ncbi:MAG: hypothetical protein ABFS02_05490 [Pseudomonadota bacterium]
MTQGRRANELKSRVSQKDILVFAFLLLLLTQMGFRRLLACHVTYSTGLRPGGNSSKSYDTG